MTIERAEINTNQTTKSIGLFINAHTHTHPRARAHTHAHTHKTLYCVIQFII